MAKTKAPPASPPATSTLDRSFWPAFVLIAICSGLTGALLTYLVLQPRLRPSAVAALRSAEPGSTSHAPAPELTAGMSPAQADRTLGNFYYDHSDWLPAAKYYESALRQGSDDADIRTDLGNAYQFSGRADDALAQYHTAQRLNPQHEFSLFNQGGLYADRLGNPAKAIEVWDEYLRRFPSGQNAATARQLITQTRAQLTGAIPSVPVASGLLPAQPADATEDRLLKLVKPDPAPGKP